MLFCIFKIPEFAFTVIAPLYALLFPAKINVLVLDIPSFTITPDPVIIPVIARLPRPPTFKPPLFVTPPVLIVKVVETSILILDAVLIVTRPVILFAPIAFLIAPVELIPVPFIIIDSGIIKPSIRSLMAAPLAMVVELDPVPAVALPNASLLLIITTPALIDVAPAYVLALFKIKVSVPVFVIPPEDPDITPLILIPLVASSVTI